MFLSRWLGESEAPSIAQGRVYLRQPQRRDMREWIALRQSSRRFLEPWEPLWTPEELTASGYRHRLALIRAESGRGEGYTFLVFRKKDHVLLGGLSLGNIRHGVAMTATLGYWMGEAHAGQGYMREAVGAVLDHAFGTLGLHRVEAGCLPRNDRSAHLLRRVGFQQEGLARAYLKINGLWEDHLLFAIISTDRTYK